ncbi:MAG: bifunctional folylpolyglutamate synthase/dihydrofolate synthase [Candidatus Obscuribacterales bacterium]|nr:bifunctional folylpolyglutamate synthase/dihydrofolate synthase [Candidatus Obscuribacterales bacterium]
MNYLESIAYLDSLSPTLEKPGLERITLFLQEHDQPQNRIPCIHVGGTNGKGSTVAILDSTLRQCGLKVARFTGPHLLRWNERFHVNGQAISDEQFAKYASQLRVLSEAFARKHPELGILTWFEFITVLAFQYFVEQKVEISVIEVGLGGRFDATNAVGNVLVSVITNVDLDHKHILGNTVELIAFEKAGIIKAGVPVVTAAQGGALEVILERAKSLNTDIYVLSGESAQNDESDAVVDLCSLNSLSLMGEHQRVNARLAYAALKLCGGKIGDEIRSRLATAWEDGIKNTYWAGRMQYLPKYNLILDGAHNPAGAVALRAALDTNFPDQKCLFVITCFSNKDATGIISTLARPGDRVFFSEAASRREVFSREKFNQLSAELGLQSLQFETTAGALKAAVELKKPDEVIVATGSFATVRESMLALGWLSVEDGCIESGRIGDAIEVVSHKKELYRH